jgi:FdhE protein
VTNNQAKIAFLEETGRAVPEYAEILALFREVFAYIDSKQGAVGLSFQADTEHQAERIRNGFPLFSPEVMTVNVPETTKFLSGLLLVLEKKSREGEELKQIEAALVAGKLDLPLLLTACLRSDRSQLEEAAESCNLNAQLLEFVLETVLKASLEPLAATFSEKDFSGWQEGVCPVCGSRAGMGELVGEEGRRYLSCCTCFFKWPYKRLQCPSCGNDDSSTLSYFTADDGPVRVDTCRKCSRYLKTRDTRKGHADVPLEVEDLATIHLDLMAGREGFERGK